MNQPVIEYSVVGIDKKGKNCGNTITTVIMGINKAIYTHDDYHSVANLLFCFAALLASTSSLSP